LRYPEALAPLLVARCSCSLPVRKDPGVKRGIWLGIVLGIAMLGRDELDLVVFLLSRWCSWPGRSAGSGAFRSRDRALGHRTRGGALGRVQPEPIPKPVFISTGLGVTLASADCAATYSGPAEGYWSMPCALASSHNPWFKEHPKADDSAQGAEYQHLALDYVRSHESRLVPVTLAKIGRAFGFFHPLHRSISTRTSRRGRIAGRSRSGHVLRPTGAVDRRHRRPPPPPHPLVPALGYRPSRWCARWHSPSARPGTGPPSRCHSS